MKIILGLHHLDRKKAFFDLWHTATKIDLFHVYYVIVFFLFQTKNIFKSNGILFIVHVC